MAHSLGIDIGGTFTDVVLVDHNTSQQIILTSAHRPAVAVVEGVKKIIAKAGVDASEIERLVHATTLFTNTLIERKGTKTALITTKDFRDILEIAPVRSLADILSRPALLVSVRGVPLR